MRRPWRTPSAPHELGGRLYLLDHVGCQVARVGSRISQRLVLLIQTLCRGKCAPRREAVARIGLALQRREVVQHRRTLALLLLVELGDRPLPALTGRDDRKRLLLGGQARLRTGMKASCVDARTFSSTLAGCVVCAPVAPLRIALLISAGSDSRVEARVHQPIGLGHERLDLLLATRDDRKRRRLHAPKRNGPVEGRFEADRGSAGGVHADDPVGLRARARGLLEQRIVLGRPQRFEGALHRGRGHRVQPQTLHRLLRFGLLI